MPLRFTQDDIDEKVNGFNLKFKEVETNLNAIKEKSGYKASMGNWVAKQTRTAWKVSLFGIFLVCIFLYSDWMRTRITADTDTFHAVSYTSKIIPNALI